MAVATKALPIHLVLQSQVDGRRTFQFIPFHSLTYYEEGLHDHVRGHRHAFKVLNKGGVVGHCNGYVNGGHQDQPVPAALEHAVVREDEPRLFQRLCFVFGQWGVRGMK